MRKKIEQASRTSLAVTARPEEELLLYCARKQLDDEAAVQLKKLLKQDIDWSYLLRLGRDHWIMPLLYWHFKEVNASAIPQFVMEELRKHFQDNYKRNLFFVGELRTILELFAANGIRALPFKGPILAQCAYGSVALRAFTDLDILIDEDGLPKTKRLLLSIGYEPRELLTDAEERIRQFSSYEYGFTHHSHGAEVDIEWAAWKRGLGMTLSSMGLWERALPKRLFGVDTLVTTPEDTLLLTCIHGMKHLWQDLQWICDVDRLIQANPELNWNALLGRARTFGSERMLFVGILLAGDVLRTRLPKTVVQTAQGDGTAKALVRRIERGLFQEPAPQTELAPAVRILTFQDAYVVLLSKERFRDKALAICSFAFMPTMAEYESFPLPTTLFKLYYVIRPLRLAARYASYLLGRFA